MLHLFWAVVLSSILVNGFPSGEPANNAGPAHQLPGAHLENVGEDGEEQSGAEEVEPSSGPPRLQLAFLVEDQQYTRHPDSEIPQTARRSKSSVYGRRRRRSAVAHHQTFSYTSATNKSAVQQQSDSFTPTPLTADSPLATRNFGNIARILAIAGTKPKAVDPSGGYSGRRKRRQSDFAGFHHSRSNLYNTRPQPDTRYTSFQVEEEQQIVAEAGAAPESHVVPVAAPVTPVTPVTPKVASPSGRDFGNIGRILAIAGTKPKAVDPSGGYSGRKKRSARSDVSPEAEAGVYQNANLKLSPAQLRKRSAKTPIKLSHGVVQQVAPHAVKIQSRGRYGNLAHHRDNAGPVVFDFRSPIHFRGSDTRRYKRDELEISSRNFIPFSVYDQRRVRTLKVEQNDALALPLRLELEKAKTTLSPKRLRLLKIKTRHS